MNFYLAYMEMQEGLKIRRPGWKGYWFIECGKFKIKLASGEVMENGFTGETIHNCSKNDWEVVHDEI